MNRKNTNKMALRFLWFIAPFIAHTQAHCFTPLLVGVNEAIDLPAMQSTITIQPIEIKIIDDAIVHQKLDYIRNTAQTKRIASYFFSSAALLVGTLAVMNFLSAQSVTAVAAQAAAGGSAPAATGPSSLFGYLTKAAHIFKDGIKDTVHYLPKIMLEIGAAPLVVFLQKKVFRDINTEWALSDSHFIEIITNMKTAAFTLDPDDNVHFDEKKSIDFSQVDFGTSNQTYYANALVLNYNNLIESIHLFLALIKFKEEEDSRYAQAALIRESIHAGTDTYTQCIRMHNSKKDYAGILQETISYLKMLEHAINSFMTME